MTQNRWGTCAFSETINRVHMYLEQQSVPVTHPSGLQINRMSNMEFNKKKTCSSPGDRHHPSYWDTVHCHIIAMRESLKFTFIWWLIIT